MQCGSGLQSSVRAGEACAAAVVAGAAAGKRWKWSEMGRTTHWCESMAKGDPT